MNRQSDSELSVCLKWGIIGAGDVANDFCVGCSVLPAHEQQLVAVASRCKEKSEKFALKHQIAKSYGSYKELLEDEDIDIVYIATVTHTHKSLCLLALEHGKHVLCEKAMAVNAGEAKDMIETAREKNLFFMESLWSVFFPAWLELKSKIKHGSIGQPKLIDIVLANKFYSKRPRFYDPDLCGGMLNSMGAYAPLLAYFVLGDSEPIKISAVAINRDNGVDKSSTVALKYKDGCILNFSTSNEYDYNNGAVIIGDKGYIRLEHPYYCATKMETEEGLLEFPVPTTDKPNKFSNAAGFSYEIQHVRQCLLKGKIESPILTHDVTMKLLQQMDEIRRQLGITYEQDQIQR